jgi:hypothetical protein
MGGSSVAAAAYFEIVVLSEQSDDRTEDRDALHIAVFVFGHNTRAHFDHLTDLQHTAQDTATRHTTLQVVHLLTCTQHTAHAKPKDRTAGKRVESGGANQVC